MSGAVLGSRPTVINKTVKKTCIRSLAINFWKRREIMDKLASKHIIFSSDKYWEV